MRARINGSLLCWATVLLVGVSRGTLAAEPDSADWEPLFDGKTPDGWEVLEDKGNFFVEDDMIVGETSAGVKGSNLCTKEKFGNFVLEVEFKVDKGLNSELPAVQAQPAELYGRRRSREAGVRPRERTFLAAGLLLGRCPDRPGFRRHPQGGVRSLPSRAARPGLCRGEDWGIPRAGWKR